MPTADPSRGPLLGRWAPGPAGALAWVARVARDEADTWLSGHVRQIAAAAALAPRLEARMLGAVAGSTVEEFDVDLADDEFDVALDFTAGADPDAALRREFTAVRAFAEGRLTAAVHLGDALAGVWQRARLDAGDLFEQAGALLQGGAVETHTAAGRRVAVTAVDWSGDLATAWTPGLAAWEVDLHHGNVGLALRAREVALDGIAAAARGAARLAALIAAPAPTAAAITLPLAWRYLRRLWHG